MSRHPELLIPASSLEVLKTAVVFGADAVYIGGDSLNALKLIRKINEKYNIVITIKDLYENASVRKLAKRIIEKTEDYNEGIL